MKSLLRFLSRRSLDYRILLSLIPVMTALLVTSGCARKKAPSVVYINRPLDLTPAEAQAVATAKNEVTKWDLGAEIIDYRVQRHGNGYTVSLLISGSYDKLGNPLYGKQPIRNVEIDQTGAVVGYHISR